MFSLYKSILQQYSNAISTYFNPNLLSAVNGKSLLRKLQKTANRTRFKQTEHLTNKNFFQKKQPKRKTTAKTKNKKARRSPTLTSHCRTLPSAVQVLTSVFGMGTCVSPEPIVTEQSIKSKTSASDIGCNALQPNQGTCATNNGLKKPSPAKCPESRKLPHFLIVQ